MTEGEVQGSEPFNPEEGGGRPGKIRLRKMCLRTQVLTTPCSAERDALEATGSSSGGAAHLAVHGERNEVTSEQLELIFILFSISRATQGSISRLVVILH